MRIREGFYNGKSEKGQWWIADAPPEPPTGDSVGWFTKLITGGYGLAKTYWLFGVLPGLLPIHLVMTGLAAAGQFGAMIIFAVLALAWNTVVAIGIWRACNTYTGPKIWPILVKLQISLAAAGLLVGLIAVIVTNA